MIHLQILSTFKRFIAALLCLGFLFACAADQASLDAEKQRLIERHATTTKKTSDVKALNDQLFAAARITTDPADRLLGAGDLVQITIFEAKELNTEARVSSRGFITLPLLGQITVKGLSAREAEMEIENQYRQKFIKDPHVSIFIKEHFSQRVTLVGQVAKPGTVDYHSKQRLLDVLALAGGLTDKAGGMVEVRREGTQESFLIDIDKLIKEGQAQLNIEINGGDVIFVAEAGTFFVDGAVRRPGSYQIKQHMVLQEALLMAGGFVGSANKEKITLVRRSSDDQQTIIELDLVNNPEAKNIALKDRDVLIAEYSAMGKLMHGTGINIGIPGLIGVGYRDPEGRNY